VVDKAVVMATAMAKVAATARTTMATDTAISV
jgi:hypothetical protein